MKKGLKISIIAVFAVVLLLVIAAAIGSCSSQSNADVGAIVAQQFVPAEAPPTTDDVAPTPTNWIAIAVLGMLISIAFGGCVYKIINKIKRKKYKLQGETINDERAN